MSFHINWSIFGWKVRADPKHAAQKELDIYKPRLISAIDAAVDQANQSGKVTPTYVKSVILDEVKKLNLPPLAYTGVFLAVEAWNLKIGDNWTKPVEALKQKIRDLRL